MKKSCLIKKNKRKMTSVWGLALYIILSISYIIFILKTLKETKREELSTGALEMYDEVNRFWTTQDPISTIYMSRVTLQEKEFITFDIATYFLAVYVFVFFFFVFSFLIFSKDFLRRLPMSLFFYNLLFFLLNSKTLIRSLCFGFGLLCINLMLFENGEYNLEKMVTIFNSYFKMLYKPSVFLFLAIAFSFSYIVLQLYLIVNINLYIEDINILVYPCLIIYFVISFFTTLLFLSSFTTSLCFYCIIHKENFLSAFYNTCLNVLYNSGEICVYGIEYYRLNFMAIVFDIFSVVSDDSVHTTIKILLTILKLVIALFSPFLNFISVDGYHPITYLTLTGKRYRESIQKINNLTQSLEMIPFFNVKHEYLLYMNAVMSILTYHNFLLFMTLFSSIIYSLLDQLMWTLYGYCLLLFFGYFFNVLYSSVLFLYILCGETLNSFEPKIYKLFERKRENIRFNDLFLLDEDEDTSE